jgi:hypothetical protein
MASASVNTNIWRFTSGQWAMTTYQDEVQYNFFTRNIPQAWWTGMYRDVLNDLKESGRIINESANIIPGVKTNMLAQVDITQVLVWSVMVNTLVTFHILKHCNLILNCCQFMTTQKPFILI